MKYGRSIFQIRSVLQRRKVPVVGQMDRRAMIDRARIADTNCIIYGGAKGFDKWSAMMNTSISWACVRVGGNEKLQLQRGRGERVHGLRETCAPFFNFLTSLACWTMHPPLSSLVNCLFWFLYGPESILWHLSTGKIRTQAMVYVHI